MSRSLDRLFRPASVAVIGGSWAANVVEQCLAMNFQGALWPITVSDRDMHGLTTYRSLSELPGVPDAVYIGVNREQTIEIVTELSNMGAGGAVCFASGFSESAAEDSAGTELEARLLAAAGDMPILGPNCYGFINYLDGALLWPDQHGGTRSERGVALLCQSSNIAINLTMQRRALAVSYVVTAGNQSQQSLGALGSALLDDERVTAIGMYVEGYGDINAFQRMAQKARQCGKGIVVVKGGRSQQAQQAMVSHTNSLSGSDAAADAFLKRLGIARVDSLSVLLEALKLLHTFGPLADTTIQSMSCSGGEAALMADAAVGSRVRFPELSDKQYAQLRDALGPRVALANPLDYHTYIWGRATQMRLAYTAMLEHSTAELTLLVIDFPRTDRCDSKDWDLAIDMFLQACQSTGKRGALLTTLHENLSEQVAMQCQASGVVVMMGMDDAIKAIEAAASTALAERVVPLVWTGNREGNVMGLSEAISKQRLAAHGLRVPASFTVETVDQLEMAWASSGLHFPVVVKGLGFEHKSENSAVVLGVDDQSALIRETECLLQFCPSILIEEQIDTIVVELLVSIVNDPVHGFMLTLAAGGTMTELLQDAEQLLLPFTQADIRQALSQLRIAPLFDGYRNGPACNMSALIESIMALQCFTEENLATLREVEINPMLCTPDAAIVADAIIQLVEKPT